MTAGTYLKMRANAPASILGEYSALVWGGGGGGLKEISHEYNWVWHNKLLIMFMLCCRRLMLLLFLLNSVVFFFFYFWPGFTIDAAAAAKEEDILRWGRVERGLCFPAVVAFCFCALDQSAQNCTTFTSNDLLASADRKREREGRETGRQRSLVCGVDIVDLKAFSFYCCSFGFWADL